MTPRSLAAAGLTVAALVLFAGCSAGPDSAAPDSAVPGSAAPGSAGPAVRQRGPSAEVTAALDAAVAGVDAARADLLASPAAVVEAATVLDAADEACATGRAATARAARGPAEGSVARAQAAVGSVPARTRAYRQALVDLQRAAAPLDAEQVRALGAVVATGEQEAAATEAFAAAAGAALPVYGALDEAQATWVTRASAGWYRDDAEAAGAYAVLVRPRAGALRQARDGLRAADEARRAATGRQRAALSAADAALAPLRNTG